MKWIRVLHNAHHLRYHLCQIQLVCEVLNSLIQRQCPVVVRALGTRTLRQSPRVFRARLAVWTHVAGAAAAAVLHDEDTEGCTGALLVLANTRRLLRLDTRQPVHGEERRCRSQDSHRFKVGVSAL